MHSVSGNTGTPNTTWPIDEGGIGVVGDGTHIVSATTRSGDAHDDGGSTGSTSTLSPYQVVNYINYTGVGA